MDEPRSVKLLKKIGIQSKTKKQEPVYALTNEGIQQFYRLPAYRKLKDSITYKVLSRLTRTSSPRDMFHRILGVLCLGEGASLLSILFPLGLVLTSFWLLFTISIGIIAILNLLMCQSSIYF
ncbi:MAG: hypothetical protein LUP94_02540 [Candidatus Methanomethylicus sp.]|nr:hypothetical protein [Candidatus Methanomethylicus sp.]